MLRGLGPVCCVFFVGSCALEDTTTTNENPLTRAQRLQAEAEILFSHDHVRDSTHFTQAVTGGVTATTIELIVDNLVFYNYASQREVSGPLNNAQTTFVPSCMSYPYESRSHANTRFVDALSDLQTIVSHSNGTLGIIETVQDIDAAKAVGQVGFIIGTEGTMMLADNQGDSVESDVASRIQSLYTVGWRKATIFRQFTNPFVFTSDNSPDKNNPQYNLTPLGRRLIPQLNKRGVIVDVMHLDGRALPDVLATTSAPLQMSHEWGVCTIVKDAQGNIINYGAAADPQTHRKIVAAGGGHGVISVNVLGSYYNMGYCYDGFPEPLLTLDVNGLADTLVFMVGQVGIDHVGIGPDYQPSPDTYTLSDYDQIPALIQALMGKINPQTGQPMNDADIKKILGGNLRDLYQRIWDPTHGYDGGAAHFTLCGDMSKNPDCTAAASNRGQGDLRHRAINCAHPSGLTPVGTQLQYVNGQWNFKNLANQWVHCAPSVLQSNGTLLLNSGSTLVVSWGDAELQNGRIALYGTSACDTRCQQATLFSGAGTNGVRALNCTTPSSNGVVGLQLVTTSSGWNTYNIAGSLTACTPNTTLVVDWAPTGVPNANTTARLCDDFNTHPACAAAAANGGNGSATAKALSCLSSIADEAEFGTIALQVFYQDVWDVSPLNPNQLTPVPGGGHWQYWAVDGKAHPCVHGSVVVATTLP